MRYFENSDYHRLPIPLADLQSSAARDCALCVILLKIFQWLARSKGALAGVKALHQAEVEVCVPFESISRHPVVLTYSWLSTPASSIRREYDFQISVPARCV
jgi:hypothetical protein